MSESAGSKMLAEMREQPGLLEHRRAALFEQARALQGLRPELVVFAARGSSDNACRYGRYLFEVRLGVPSMLAAPSVLTRYGADIRYPRALVVGVSQSAAAVDVAEVLSHARRKGHSTVSITNEERGPVVDAAEHHIFLGAGTEVAVAATKTFSLSLLALYQLARALGAQLAEPDLAESAEASLRDPRAELFASELVASRLSFALARGFHFAIAEETALKLMECALQPCRPYSLSDFAHGPIALAGPGVAALVLGKDGLDETAKTVRRRLIETGARVMELGLETELSAELAPISDVILGQRLAYFAAIASGLDPDRPRHLEKVTLTR